jgi:hypothetical protein
MLYTVGTTTAVWLAVTFLTKPEPDRTLIDFYRRTRPSETGWRRVARLAPGVKAAGDGLSNLLCWIAGCALIYCSLFGVGKLILKEYALGSLLLVLSVLAGAIIYRDLTRRGWAAVAE